ncbi:hypothetical protein [Micromonospora zhanjiangensis]|uniref:DNA binding domain-containing protein, excisionase family n=1 Tax=Micromonospora zhanjiangensis TaxID=1522057 RepID=A0ABV8KPA7_9ACTN
MNGTQNTGTGTAAPEPLVYRLPAAGQVLGGLSRRSVSKLIAEKKLQAVVIGGIRMVTRASCEKYLAEQMARPEELEQVTNRTAKARKVRQAKTTVAA